MVGQDFSITPKVCSLKRRVDKAEKSCLKLSGHLDTSTNQHYEVLKASKVFPSDGFTKLNVSPDKIKLIITGQDLWDCILLKA
jgi:hypothetical protein